MARNLEQSERGTLFRADVGPFRDDSAEAKSLSGFASSYSIRWLKDRDEDICPAIKDIFGISSYAMYRCPLLAKF